MCNLRVGAIEELCPDSLRFSYYSISNRFKFTVVSLQDNAHRLATSSPFSSPPGGSPLSGTRMLSVRLWSFLPPKLLFTGWPAPEPFAIRGISLEDKCSELLTRSRSGKDPVQNHLALVAAIHSRSQRICTSPRLSGVALPITIVCGLFIKSLLTPSAGGYRGCSPVSNFLNQVSNFLTNFQFFFFSSTAARYY